MTLENRLRFSQARAAWGVPLLSSREHVLEDLFPDLPAKFDDWDKTSNDVVLAFKDQRQDAAPVEPRTIWQLDGTLTATPGMDVDRVLSFTRISMVHADQLPPLGLSSTTRPTRPST